MPTYVDDATILTAVAKRLKFNTSAALIADAPQWSQIVTDANTEAYNAILATMANRGYAKATIDSWDRAAEFNRKIATCIALRNGAVIDDVALDKICDCEQEMKESAVFVSGVWTAPDYPLAGNIGYGTNNTANDTFTTDSRF